LGRSLDEEKGKIKKRACAIRPFNRGKEGNKRNFLLLGGGGRERREEKKVMGAVTNSLITGKGGVRREEFGEEIIPSHLNFRGGGGGGGGEKRYAAKIGF